VAGVALFLVVLAFTFTLLLGALSYSYPEVVQFLVGGTDDLVFLTPSEFAHMQDVRELMAQGMLLSLGAVLLLFFISQWSLIQRTVIRNALLTALLIALLLAPFHYSFTLFHQLFFSQGNWQFPQNSWLISHFSTTFFATVTSVWFGSTLVLLGLLYRVHDNNERKYPTKKSEQYNST
jgi:uncharacterized membrane protein